MKKLYSIILLFTMLLSCTTNEKKQTEGYTIKGTVNNLNVTKAYLVTANNTLIDSSDIVLNNFEFFGNVTTAEISSIQFDNDSISVPFLLDNNSLYVYVSPYKQHVFGSALQNELNIYNERVELLEKAKLKLGDKFATTNVAFKSTIDSLNTVEFNYLTSAIKKINHAPIANFFIDKILNEKDLNIDEIICLEALAKEKNNLKALKTIDLKKKEFEAIALKEKQRLENLSKKAIEKREKVILFVGESLNGKDLGLATILKGKKTVLIDFWASWCGPCRKITPQVRALYQKYKSKGFDIVTVSEDKSHSAWKNGIAEDNMLAWNHIYDDHMRIANMFRVNTIPYMVLIDGEGGIIASKISIDSLEKELQKIFN